MLWEQRYEFKKNMRKLTNNNQIIIANRTSGEWIKISKQCYDILNLGIEKEITINELISSLSDEDDKKYFTKLFSKLNELDIIKNKNQSDKKKIKQIDFAITNKCNLKCIHCCVDAKNYTNKDVLSTEDVCNIIDKIIAYNPERINFTGGEPLLREDFFDILEYTSKRYDGKIGILTNATLINENNVKILTDAISNIDISIDGIDEKSCSLIRGKGVFNKVIESIKLLQKNNFNKICLSMVITDKNKQFRDEFYKMNERLGTRGIVRKFSPIGRGEVNKNLLMKKNIEEQKEPYLSENKLKKLSKELRTCRCGAMNKTVYINYEGFIYPCGLLIKEEYKICHVNDIDNFQSYFDSDNYVKSKGYESLIGIQPDVFEKCKNCNVNLFCWNCLHHLDLARSNEKMFESNCSLIKKQLEKLVWNV